jgi:hypothetical protein
MALAMLAPVLALPRAPNGWPLPAIAPALGVVGLAGAWPALAANAKSLPRRAALGATGWLWLCLVSALAHKSLYTKSTTPTPSHWAHSVASTVTQVLSPLLTASTLAAALIWAIAAATLPLVRGRRAVAMNVALTAAWAMVLAVAITIAAPAILPGEAALGAIAAIVFTLAPDVTKRLARPTPSGDLRSMELR